MKHKLSDYALIAEIISAIAIVLSLVFVGLQLNSNAKATRSATANTSVATQSNWYAALGRDADTSAVFLRAMGNPDEQTPEQWLQFVFMMHGTMLNFQNSFYLVEEGTLDPEIRDSLTDVLLAIKDQPGFQRYWQQRHSIFFPEFQDYVDDIFASDETNSIGVYKEFSPNEAQE